MLSHKVSLKTFLIEMTLDKKDILQPEDIYNFYYMNYLLTDPGEKSNLDEDQINSIRFEMNEIKKKYLEAFLPVVRSQLEKYLKRGRVDEQSYKLEDLKTAVYENLDAMMRRTYRSDMKRRNINWENLTKNLTGLQNTSNVKQVMYYIDRINNAIHNAQESMMVKFLNGEELMKALGDSHRLKPEQLKLKTADLGFLKEEQEVGKAYVFDFDDTLVKTASKIKVLKQGKLVTALTPEQFNTYKRNPDEIFDFTDFDKIIEPKKFKAWKILENIDKKIGAGKSNSTIYILTARCTGIIDDMEKFFKGNGIKNISRDNIFAIGGEKGKETVAEKKREVLEQIKVNHNDQVEFFDDAPDNIKLAQSIGVKSRQIVESILDEPQKEMDQKIWEGVPPRLKQEIFVQIAEGLLFLGEDAPITKLIIAGSLTGYRWTEESDLDVTVILDVEDEELEKMKEGLSEANGQLAGDTKHPINYFLMNNDPGLARFDSAYEPLSKEWLKPPKTEGINISDVYDQFKSFVKKIDVEKEEAKRSIVDIKLLEKALENSADPKTVAEKIVQRIQDLDKAAGDLAQTFKKVHKDRNQAFSDYEKAGGGSESPNLQPDNIKYKLLERYHYLDFLKQLYKLMKKDGVETPEGFEKVDELLSKNEEIVTTKFNEEIATIDGEKALSMAIGPLGMVGGRAFLWDKFDTDEFMLGSSISGHAPLLSQLQKRTHKQKEEDKTIRGYWIPAKKALIVWPYVVGSKNSIVNPDEDDIDEVAHKLDVIPSTTYVIDMEMEEEKNREDRIKIERNISDEKKKILIDFIKFVEKAENTESPVKIVLQDGRGELRTTGVYSNKEKTLRVNIKNRALVDVLRTLAHELVHHRQNEKGDLNKHPHQDIGGPIEDEANSKAGIYIKKFAKDTGTDIYADEVNILEDVEFIIEQTLERLNAAE